MSKLNVSEAARAAGKPRSTIHRHMNGGVLSAERDATGQRRIDVSELQRVYGKLNLEAVAPGAEQGGAMGRAASVRDAAELELLRVKLAYTERERDEVQRREREQAQAHREERDRLLGIIETQTSQIKALAAPAEFTKEPTLEPRRGFWRRLFG